MDQLLCPMYSKCLHNRHHELTSILISLFRNCPPENLFRERGDLNTVLQIPCIQFSVTDSGSKNTTEVFLIQEGPEKGLVKRVVQNDTVKKEYVMITFKAYQVEVPIVPPEIIE